MSEKVNNKNENIKLSVAIPTYNGSRYIREALDSIITQLGDIDEEIEIVISDNASTDQTPEIIREYQKKYSFIKYFRNEENVGGDRNYDLAVRRATGEYVWLFSDDDKIRDGGIRKVIEVINKYPIIAAIFVNYESSYPFNCSQDCLCLNGDDFFNKTCFRNSLASSNVIRKAEWELVDTTKYFYTNWIHMGVLIEVVSTNQGFIISRPFVLQIPGEKRWGEGGLSFNIGLGLVKIFKNMSKYNYNKNMIIKTISDVQRRYLTGIPLAKAAGLTVDINLIREVCRLYKSFPSFWVIDLPLLLMPNIFYKILYKACKTKLFNKLCKNIYDKIS